ncbi:DNA replication complex GINS family protein, partial [Halorubrum yunnanense]
MNLDELRSAQSKERRKDSLQHLRDSFYDDVAAYVADLRAARDRRAEQVEKPFSDDDVRRLSDEVETAEEVAEALYERRVGKVVKLASFAAADMSVDADGMTTEERRLFDDLVDRIKANKSTVLDVLSGEVSVDESASEPGETAGDQLAGDRPPTGDVAADSRTDSREDPTPPATDPEPEPAEGRNAAEGAGDEVPDALAGAMGGGDEGVADTLGATSDGTGEASETAPPADAPERDGRDAAGEDAAAAEGATTDGGPTAVPPDPAPPGAPGTGGGESPSGADPADGASDSPDSESAIDDRATVRITRDVGAIF